MAGCCWCQRILEQRDGHWWCPTSACRRRQILHGIGTKDRRTRRHTWRYVPTPKQVEFDACRSKYVLHGGAAGPGKSHGARGKLYRRAQQIPHFEALLLRKTFPELEKTHLRRIAQDAEWLGADFTESKRLLTFTNGSLIECGHMQDAEAVQKYLSTEYDCIIPDEGATFEPHALLELSTRARTSKPQVLAVGGAQFCVVSNPGGPASSMLLDFFIDHQPAWEQFPATLRRTYDPAQWTYIPATLDDNPYLDPDYEESLTVLSPWRYEQLRHGDWRVFVGQFFSEWNDRQHVRDLEPDPDGHWFRSMDWGRNQPGCVLWWAVLPDHQLYIRREYKFSGMDEQSVAAAVLAIDRELGLRRVAYTAADPAILYKMGATHPDGTFVGQSIGETLNHYGLNLIRGDNDRFNGWGRCHALLRPGADGTPWLTAHSSCRYLIRSIAAAVSDATDPDDVDTKSDDHALDAWRYGAMSRPSPAISTTYQRFAEGTMGELRQSVKSVTRRLGSESVRAH